MAEKRLRRSRRARPCEQHRARACTRSLRAALRTRVHTAHAAAAAATVWTPADGHVAGFCDFSSLRMVTLAFCWIFGLFDFVPILIHFRPPRQVTALLPEGWCRKHPQQGARLGGISFGKAFVTCADSRESCEVCLMVQSGGGNGTGEGPGGPCSREPGSLGPWPSSSSQQGAGGADLLPWALM